MVPHVEMRCDGCPWALSIRLLPDLVGGTWTAEFPFPEHQCDNGREFMVTEYLQADSRGIVPQAGWSVELR